MDEQIGLETSVDEYITSLVNVFKEIKRVLRGDGTLWLHLGDAYAGSGRGRNADGRSNLGNTHSQSKGQQHGIVSLPKEVECLKQKDLIGLPWRVAFALQQDG